MLIRIALIIVLCFIVACTPSNPERWMAFEKNACLPTAIAMAQGLRRQGIQARVVRYSYNDGKKLTGHAITSYLYPPGKNQLWTYDYVGSWRTYSYFNDPWGTAAAAERLRGRTYTILSAEFLDN
jgi:hypothetical protein